MPSCFQLIDRNTGQPEFFQVIDQQLCQHLELPFSDTVYVADWYDFIGLSLALGLSFAEITDMILADIAKYKTRDWTSAVDRHYTLLRINHFLIEHYTSDAWREW